MTALYEWLSEASLWWWPRFADHLWQTTLFVMVVLVAAFALRRGPARLRHNFWLIASAKFIVPAVLFVFMAQQAGVDSLPFFRDVPRAEQNSLIVNGVTEPVLAIASNYEITVVANPINDHKDIYFALTAVWLVGFLTLVAVWAIRRRRFFYSLKLGRRMQTGREWQALARAKKTLGLQTNIGLLISPLQIEPAAWRVWRPVVVMPESIANQLDDEELEAIMLHELVHIQRRDNLIGNLQLALSALLWFHPLVWFISRRLFDEREQACDERVMEVCGAREAYASSILKVVRFCFGWKFAGVTGAASGSNLRRRIENIMSFENTNRSAGAASLLAGALVGIALLVLVGAGVYSKAQGRNAASDVIVASVEVAPVGNSEVASSLDYEPGWTAQKAKRVMPPPPPPAPAQPSQPGQPPQAPQPLNPPPPPPKPAQASQPAQAPQPSQGPNPASVPVPPQAPQPTQAPEPSQGPRPSHLVPAAPAAIGIGRGTGVGISRSVSPGADVGSGRGIGAGVSGGAGVGRAPHAAASTLRPGAATGVSRGAVGVGGVAPSSAPSTIAPASPGAAPAPRAFPANQEKSKPQPKEKVEKGALIEAPHPVYPEEAKRQKIEGTVAVTITIGVDGNVIFAKAKSGPEPLYEASQEAAYKARFKPTMKDGKPVKVAAVMSYNFVLDKK